MMAFYGVGNHGGGPTIELITKIKERGRRNEVFSTPDEFFDATSDLDLPVVRDELQHHAQRLLQRDELHQKEQSQVGI